MNRTVRVFIATTILLLGIACLGLGRYPEIEILYPPTDRFECASGHIPITGRVQCTGCELSAGKDLIEIAQDGSFTYDARLKPGGNLIELKLRERNGLEITRTLDIRNGGTGNVPFGPGDELVPVLPPIHSPEEAAFPGNAPSGKTGKMEKKPAAAPEKPYAPPQEPAPPAAAGQTASGNMIENNAPAPEKTAAEPGKSNRHADISAPARGLSAITIFLDGKPLGTESDYLNEKDRIYIPMVSAVWAKANAAAAPGGYISFSYGNPFKPILVSYGAGAAPGAAAIEAGGAQYLPIRSVFERAGWSVHWEPGRVYLDFQNRTVPITVAGGGSIEGIIHRNVLFIRAEDLAKLGLAAEAVGSDGVRLAGGGRSVSVTRLTYRGCDMIVELASGSSPPARFAAPGREMTDREYLIPLRAVLSEMGIDVKWDKSAKTASISTETTVSRRP